MQVLESVLFLFFMLLLSMSLDFMILQFKPLDTFVEKLLLKNYLVLGTLEHI